MGSQKRSKTTSLADALFGKTTKAVIGRLFSRPEQSWHLRELARLSKVSPTMLSKEIDSLSAAGIVLDEPDGNRRRVRANPQCPIFDELRGIARKTAGVADLIRAALEGIQGIDCAFVFGSVARGEERAGSDVDVCVVGPAKNRDVMSAMASAEEAVGRPVNALVYTVPEIREKMSNGSTFVSNMLSSEKIFLIGDADELERAVGEFGEGGLHLSEAT